MQARNKTGHGKIDRKNCLLCTRENNLDKKLVKEKLLVCAGLIRNLAQKLGGKLGEICVQPGFLQTDIYSKTS